MKQTLFRIVAGVCFVLALVFVQQGFDKKDNYYNNESAPSLSTNAYVGGDAYNFIINGTYFTGYIVLGSAMLISGMLALVISETKTNNVTDKSALLSSKDKQEDILTKF